jgi:hypothetical protein
MAVEPVTIWIRKVPATGYVEGVDLRHYDFREGEVYDVGHYVAELLISCGFAELDRRRENQDGQTEDRRYEGLSGRIAEP